MERPPSAAARWTGAVICFVYGFAKLNGSQFTVLDSELTRPLGEVSGFWLTWYYFGYSPIYGNLLGLIQIVLGALLVVPRTSLLGALLLLPVVTNIILIDVFYRIDLGATTVALVLLLCVCLIAAPYVPRLRSAVLLRSLPGRPTAGSFLALVLVIVGSFTMTWWTANYNNRAPTSIDGIWAVTPQTDDHVPASGWRWVFFEYNRAHLAVFRGASGPDEQHHFEVDTEGVVRVWQNWLTKGPLIMQGRRTSENNIELVTQNASGDEHLLLHRIKRTP